MVAENHTHDFDQFLFFTGGDGNNMPDLGGVVELTLSKDGKKLEKFTITEATCVFIPAGLYHCPLNFKKINDPKKPIIFQNLFFTAKYERNTKK
jgi:mannose-6-phosphate isomerase-like protein (cupin superfamily)